MPNDKKATKCRAAAADKHAATKEIKCRSCRKTITALQGQSAAREEEGGGRVGRHHWRRQRGGEGTGPIGIGINYTTNKTQCICSESAPVSGHGAAAAIMSILDAFDDSWAAATLRT